MIEGDPILLGVLHSDPPRQAKTLVQTCKYHPLKAAWMAGSCIVGGEIWPWLNMLCFAWQCWKNSSPGLVLISVSWDFTGISRG